MDLRYTVRCLEPSVYALSQGHVRAFLLVGAERALLVDTCFGGELREVVSSLTDKPVTLVSTHADGDHIGGDADSPEHFAHRAELAPFAEHSPALPPPVGVEEGYVFELEPFRLEVVHLPGHTPGSIALLEREKRFIISGDVLCSEGVFLFGKWRNVPDYRASLVKLCGMKDAFDRVYPSHGAIPLPPSHAEKMLFALDEVLAGRCEVSPTGNPHVPPEIKSCQAEGISFLLAGY